MRAVDRARMGSGNGWCQNGIEGDGWSRDAIRGMYGVGMG